MASQNQRVSRMRWRALQACDRSDTADIRLATFRGPGAAEKSPTTRNLYSLSGRKDVDGRIIWRGACHRAALARTHWRFFPALTEKRRGGWR
jgi:hypothetical protein